MTVVRVRCASSYANKGRVFSPDETAPTVCAHWEKDLKEGLVIVPFDTDSP